MRFYTTLFAFVALIGSLMAQNWESVGKFNSAPSKIWYDSTEQRLLVAGYFTWFDSTEIHGFGYVQGDSVIPLGCGFEIDCGINVNYNAVSPKVTDFARYNGELYATGYFKKAGGVTVNGTAKWGGSDWVPIGTGLSLPGSSTGVGFGLDIIENDLYIVGAFDSINGVEAHGIAKFDGASWSAVHSFPKFNPSPTSPNRVFDAEWFQGELYVGGSFYQLGTNPPLNALTKWNGTEWVAVGNGFSGSFAGVGQLETFKGKLIIAGHFNKYQNPGSIPGNAITAWDGFNWDTLRGGLAYRSPGGAVDELIIHGNELYVAGYYDSAGTVPAKNLAKWDGERWCGVWDENDWDVNSIAFAHDTLYMSVGFGAVGGMDSVMGLARWMGGHIGDSCQMVGVSEPGHPVQHVHLYPNPASGSFSLMMDGGEHVISLRLVDVAGRIVTGERRYVTGQPVDISMLPAGVYVVEVRPATTSGTGRGQVEYIKLIKQ